MFLPTFLFLGWVCLGTGRPTYGQDDQRANSLDLEDLSTVVHAGYQVDDQDTLQRRYGFPSQYGELSDYSEYASWEEEEDPIIQYGSEMRRNSNNPFDDPFFNNFKPKKKAPAPTPAPARAPARQPQAQEIQQVPAQVQKQPSKYPTPPASLKKHEDTRKSPTGQENKNNGVATKNDSEIIREFTLMISKLL